MPKRLPRSSSHPELCTGIYVVYKAHGLFLPVLFQPFRMTFVHSSPAEGFRTGRGSFRHVSFLFVVPCSPGLFSRCVLGLLPHIPMYRGSLISVAFRPSPSLCLFIHQGVLFVCWNCDMYFFLLCLTRQVIKFLWEGLLYSNSQGQYLLRYRSFRGIFWVTGQTDGWMNLQSSFSFLCPQSHYQLGIPHTKCLRSCVPDIFRL